METSDFKERRMTYQITMRGRDGMVMASDQRELLLPKPAEGEGSVPNMVRKIRFDSTRRFAWAFAGGKASLLAAGYLERKFETSIADADLERTLRDCGDLGWENGGPSDSTVVLADAKNKTIFRATLAHEGTVVLQMEDGRCFTGQSYSKASFLPVRFYSQEMSVDNLAILASYTVLMAAEGDPVMIGGLDVAIYRDSTGKFEFADSASCRAEAQKLDIGIRKAIVLPFSRPPFSN